MPYSNVDYIADRLVRMSILAKNMPPSWDGAKITIPVISPDGEARIGKLLPGRGLYLNCDLKSVGILRPVPFVFEKTPVMRLVDTLKSERRAIAAAAGMALVAGLSRKFLHTWIPAGLWGTITTYDGIINARAGGKATDVTFTKLSTTTVANQWHALFDVGGAPPAGAFTGTPGAVPTSATTGALSFGIPNTAGSDNCYILTFGFTSASQINMAILADLLVQVGSVAVNNGTGTISSAALTRYTGGAGVLVTFEVTTILSGTSAGTFTMSYTDQGGASGNTSASQTLTVSAAVGRLQPIATGPYMPLLAGDFGVQAVANIISSGATATTGVLAMHMYYPLAMVPGIAAGAYVERDSTIQIDGLTQLQAASNVVGCLTLYILPNAVTSGILTGFIRTCAG